MTKNKEDIREYVRKRYGEIAQEGTAGGCCTVGAPFKISDMANKIGYSEADCLNLIFRTLYHKEITIILPSFDNRC